MEKPLVTTAFLLSESCLRIDIHFVYLLAPETDSQQLTITKIQPGNTLKIQGNKMATHVLLNNIDHKDLKITTQKSADFGDNVNGILTFPTEFRDVQSEYPIFFQKDDTGQFQAIAVFGFETKQNLFLDDEGWHASYIPAVVDRGPFLIGFQTEQQNGETVRVPMIHIDMDDPRISKNQEGEAVFLPHGGNSEYLERVSRMLIAIHEGIETSKVMFNAFIALDLIEPFTIDIALPTGQTYKLVDYYTINEEKLFQLDKDTLSQLNGSGLLFAAYMVIASMSNVRKLVDKRNKLLSQ